jgi:tetratricopeptide (TPR) repeat protein
MALSLKYDYAEPLCNLGAALRRQGHLEEAIAACRQGLVLRPQWAEVHYNLASALLQNGATGEAIESFKAAIAIKPDFADALNDLGKTYLVCGNTDEAIKCFRQAIAVKPDFADAHNDLGVALLNRLEFEPAVKSLQHAVALKPDSEDACNNLGGALGAMGRHAESEETFRKLLSANPRFAPGYNNLGNALYGAGQWTRAVESFQTAIHLRPDYALAHWNLGLLLLSLGDFERGWTEYEWRWRRAEYARHDHFKKPRWDGKPLSGRRILLHTEQGFGDVIQFIRYLPRVVQSGGKVILACHSELRRLLSGMDGIEHWIDPGGTLPEYDFHCPLLSLPSVFQTTAATIPAQVPYLTADSDLSAAWRDRLARVDGKKVGLVWAGRPGHGNDRNRSLVLSQLSALGSVSGVSYISLQKGEAAKQVADGLQLTDWTSNLNDFADTAALIARLDLVITVDTAVAHLAGALAKAVWVLLPFVPDWRWMLDRDDSPWYPTMRLFRQPALGDWRTPIARIVEALKS